MSIPYRSIPAPKQFQSDTNVTLSIRKDDLVLKHIDFLLERYEARNQAATESLRRVILSDLFMTCNFWIKSFHGGNKRMLKQRYPAVLALFEAAVNELCRVFGCSQPALSKVIAEIYGRDMHAHGFQVDDDSGRAKYLSQMESKIYRLRFKGGRAYQQQWWLEKPPATLVPAESKRAYVCISRKGTNGARSESSEDFGTFVMTMEREIYMGKPSVGAPQSHAGIFHSSFTGGGVVTMAGSMLIKDGKILAIRSDSGHYAPTKMNMALLMQALVMYGVDLGPIVIYDFDGTELGTASDFFKSHMSWDEYTKQRFKEREHRYNADKEREARGQDQKYPWLKGKGPRLPDRPGTVAEMPPPVIAPTGVENNYN